MNIIKYKGITMEQALEMVEENLPTYGGSDVDVEDNSISIRFYEFSNLFQQSEVYQVMMNGGLYEEKYELADECYLESYISILFEEDHVSIDSWHELHHYVSGVDRMMFDENSEYENEIAEFIAQLKNFEMVGK